MIELFFKDKQGNVFAYRDEQEYKKFGVQGLTPMSEDEVKEHRTKNNQGVVDLAVVERNWRDSELINADIELNKVQDSDPKATGTVSDWRTYRKALRAWPEDKNFPKQEFRPKSPMNKE